MSMLQSLHQGQLLIMLSSQDVVQQRPVMSLEEFVQKVAWPGVQPSPLGGGEASVAQEPQPDQKDDILKASKPIPQEDVAAATLQVTPQPPPESTTSALDLSSPQLEPSTPVPNLPLS